MVVVVISGHGIYELRALSLDPNNTFLIIIPPWPLAIVVESNWFSMYVGKIYNVCFETESGIVVGDDATERDAQVYIK